MVAVILGIEGEGITACANEKEEENVSMYWGVFNFVVKGMNGVAIWICGMLAVRVSMEDGVLIGETAVRSMSFIAGGFLAIGVVFYYVLKALDTPQEPKALKPEEPEDHNENVAITKE